MPLSDTQQAQIEEVIKVNLRKKLNAYKPESNEMPFHFRLLGKDRMALYSFVQSLNTTFGTSIFEPVAVALAQANFVKAKAQFVVGNQISAGAQLEIQNIINALSTGVSSDKASELERLRRAAQSGQMNTLKTVKVDLFVEDDAGKKVFFDLKTAKPNTSNFKDFKRTLLEWAAIAMAENPLAQVSTLIAIPYNPYHPEPYQRWTMKGMLDLPAELKVAEEFWDFLGGDGTYQDLLDCFERAGMELRSEIDNRFAQF